MKSLSQCRLYAFVDTAYFNGRAPTTIAQQLCDGGADLIQLRAKQSAADDVRRLAESILPITQRAQVGLVINDHPEIAQQVGAELCHLGQEDFFGGGQTDVRQLTRGNHQLKVGLSTHDPDQARKALTAGPDYIAIGPVYATATKPQAQPVTPDYVRWAAANVDIPWFAIGGITLQNVDDVLAAGAQRICVVSAILNRLDIAAACQDFLRKLDRG
jgi:thiamine-phosphate pyrophosphorylase